MDSNAASYSLLTDVGVYPVINGSAFYLDDFPSPVPEGDGTYVKRDYGMSISDFYMDVWWPDMQELASDHNVRYTGVIIENYEDATDGTIKKQKDTRRFQYFGNMLLHQGGELGYHGYNHQPLSLSNVDYGDVLPYDTWKNEAAMKKGCKRIDPFWRGYISQCINVSLCTAVQCIVSRRKGDARERFPGDPDDRQ